MRTDRCALILLLGVLLTAGIACGPGGEELYNADKELVEAAVASHMSGVPESCRLPIQNAEDVFVGGRDINGSRIKSGKQYYVVAACPLLIEAFPSGILEELPNSCEAQNCANSPPLSNVSFGAWVIGNSGENTAANLSASCTGHYRWLTTLDGYIASICIGIDCLANNEDGYQGVYP